MTLAELRRFIREETAARVVAGLRDVEREAAEYVAMMLQQGPIAPLDAFGCDGSDDGADLEGFDEDLDDDADEREPVRRPAAEAPAGAVSAGRAATRERGAGQAAEAPAAPESARRARRGRRGRRRGKPAG